jgi:2-methylcitrate dehydratase PrpD
VPPALALAEYRPKVTGRELLHAIVLGMETAFRVGKAVYPEHFDAGWHITGTAGAIGAAAAAGRLLGLNEPQMTWALGLAASQPVGLRESFGSMNKSFNPGRAAQNGLLAALLAARDFTSSDQMLEAKAGGWAHTLSTRRDVGEITRDLGVRFETAFNTYLPFACGIVIHPAIDGCIRLHQEHALNPGQVAGIGLRVNPRVLQLAGKKAPASGLEGKFSVYHAAAIALIAGKAGPRQFSDEAVRSPETMALRDNVSAVVDAELKETQADVTVVMKDGRKFNAFVEQVTGSLENPMSDKSLKEKAADLMQGMLPASRIPELIDACWAIETLPQASVLARLAAAE